MLTQRSTRQHASKRITILITLTYFNTLLIIKGKMYLKYSF